MFHCIHDSHISHVFNENYIGIEIYALQSHSQYDKCNFELTYLYLSYMDTHYCINLHVCSLCIALHFDVHSPVHVCSYNIRISYVRFKFIIHYIISRHISYIVLLLLLLLLLLLFVLSLLCIYIRVDHLRFTEPSVNIDYMRFSKCTVMMIQITEMHFLHNYTLHYASLHIPPISYTYKLLCPYMIYFCPVWPICRFQSILLITCIIYKVTFKHNIFIVTQKNARHATNLILSVHGYTCTWTCPVLNTKYQHDNG